MTRGRDSYDEASAAVVLPLQADEAEVLSDLLSHDGDLLSQVLGYRPDEETLERLRRSLADDDPPHLSDLTVGTRVRLRHAVDRFPHFLAPAGATGTVTSTPTADPAGTLCVRMDEIIEGAEEWENEIVWSVGDGDNPLRDLEVLGDGGEAR